MCANREHAACGWMASRKLMPSRFSPSQNICRIRHYFMRRWKLARHRLVLLHIPTGKIDHWCQMTKQAGCEILGLNAQANIFFSRNGECKHVNRKPIIVCANKAIKKKFCWKFIWWYCTLVWLHTITQRPQILKAGIHLHNHWQANHPCTHIQIAKMHSILTCFEKFLQGLLFAVSQILLRNQL